MAAEQAPNRVRLLLLVLLAVAMLALVVTRLGGPAIPGRPASTPQARSGAAADGTMAPAQLDVRLETLEQDRPAPADTERNPFRFHAPPPPPASDAFRPPSAEPFETLGGPPSSPRAPVVKPITVRFIGVMERAGETIAIFVDCTEGRRTSRAREGEVVDGRYRLVRIGVESVVIEHLDSTGRMTLAKNGQECVR